MLKKATIQDVAEYGDFIYSLALEQAKSCYPTYADGIKTKEVFLSDARRGVTKETSELLLFLREGKVEGWIQYYWIPEDHYLQLSQCNINRGTEDALSELMEIMEERFRGYTLYFGFPGCNEEAIKFLRENGFQCIEEAWNNSFFLDNYELQPESEDIAGIGRENFDDFRAVYQPDADTYWTSDRILECLEAWTIFVYYKAGRPVGAIFLQGGDGYYEIFGLEFADRKYQRDIHQALLAAGLNACKRMGAKYLTCFCDEEAQPVLSDAGSCCVGKYVCYIKEI